MVQLENVSKVIKKNQILKNVSAQMHAGTICGIEGCNGSGKTMLMRMIAGLIYPTEGTVRIGGRALKGSAEYPVSLGMLIENPSFLDGYTGFMNLKILAAIKGQITDDEIRQALTDAGLDASDKRKYKKYSLGMKQRLGIAAALMEKPDILILDEPVNALDKDGVEMVKKLILREKERGALVILSCHDAGFLRSVSDVLYFMREGVLSLNEGDAHED